jgi:peptidoglycan hydrolase-like protein with peptidoglycan-binding domain
MLVNIQLAAKEVDVRLAMVLGIMLCLTSCGLIKVGGTVTREFGESLDETGDKEENKGTFLGKLLNLSGGVYRKVGSTLEEMAEKGKDPNESKEQLFVSANKRIIAGVVEETREFTDNRDDTMVRDVQVKLKNYGYNPGTVDGIFGSKTKKALMEFQKNNKLSVTGEIDESTLKTLGL